jgi:hypothetical protein
MEASLEIAAAASELCFRGEEEKQQVVGVRRCWQQQL